MQGIRGLLYREGYTIRGVQNILKEDGVAYVGAVGRGEVVPRKRDGVMEGAPPPGTAKAAPRVGKGPAPASVMAATQPVTAINIIPRLSDGHADSLKSALRDLGDARRLLDPGLAR